MTSLSMPEGAQKIASGKAKKAGVEFAPKKQDRAAAAAMPAKQLPRPSRHRYPIPPDVFAALKGDAPRAKIPERRLAALVADRAVRVPAATRLSTAAPAVKATPTIPGAFAGIGPTGWVPYDCAIAAGTNHIVCSVNSSVAVFDKAGAQLLRTTLNGWFANVLQGANIFDPRLAYDATAQKYLLATSAYNENQQSWFLLSVSQSADPTGPWWNYLLDATVDGDQQTQNWADYPGLGQDGQAIYLTANMFQWGDNGQFQYAKLRSIPKATVYNGGTPTFNDIVGLQNEDSSMVFTLQPCQTVDAAENEYLVNSVYPDGDNTTKSQITLWTVDNPTTAASVRRNTIPCDPYGIPPHADQQGQAPPLDTGDVRIQNVVYRKGSVWAAFNTQHNWGDAANVAALCWFEIDPKAAVLNQQGIFGASNLHYYYPAVMPDGDGNLMVAFSRSGSASYASLCCAARMATDAKGSLGGSAVLKAGTASYTGLDNSGRNRWGDYSAASPDPTDAKAAWLYGGYADPQDKWATWVAKATL